MPMLNVPLPKELIPKLGEVGFLEAFYASCALIALAVKDYRAAAIFTIRLHSLPESRIKATTIARYRTLREDLIGGPKPDEVSS
jgi:hypothetical protein